MNALLRRYTIAIAMRTIKISEEYVSKLTDEQIQEEIADYDEQAKQSPDIRKTVANVYADRLVGLTLNNETAKAVYTIFQEMRKTKNWK